MTKSTTTRSVALQLSDKIEHYVYCIARANHAGDISEANLYRHRLQQARAELSKVLEEQA